MITHFYRITALSPVAVDPDYIPGAVLRGALAYHLLHEEGISADDPLFQALCGTESPVIFRNAYLAHRSHWSEVIPLPVRPRISRGYDPQTPFANGRNAPPLTRYGYLQQEQLIPVFVDTRYLGRPVISEVQWQDQQFQPTTFFTAISSELPVSEWLQKITTVGAGKTRGFGQVTIEAVDPPPQMDVADRLEQFNRHLPDRFKSDSHDVYFTLDLQSNAIFQTPDRCPTLNPQTELNRIWGEGRVTVVWAEVQHGYQGGWNGAWGLPRPTTVIAQMGSCYLCRTASDPATLIPVLTAIERDGLGERTAEGFGQIKICSEMHVFAEPEENHANGSGTSPQTRTYFSARY
ncbi:MAG: hypothetical protein D6675_06260 [Gemmatimonadetes bacterium]|nr:MAG: hypothetical protein D6675_06260 [Gemmatimonadota bacterium]